MLHSITWQQYFLSILVAAVIYYLLVWVLLFKGKISFLPGLSNIRPMSVHAEDFPDEISTVAQHVMDELRPQFKGRHNKNELILALRLSLRSYAATDDPAFRDIITRFIVSESQSICSIRFSEEDERAVWL